MTPADRLRELIELDPRPLGELAKAAGMSQSQLSQYRSGHRADPSISVVGRILTALGRKWADLDIEPQADAAHSSD